MSVVVCVAFVSSLFLSCEVFGQTGTDIEPCFFGQKDIGEKEQRRRIPDRRRRARRPESGRPGSEGTAEAQRRFQRGIELFRGEQYEAALAEFLRANELSPHALTLFNIANTYARMNRYAEAIEYYERTLREDQRVLGARRTEECRGALQRLRSLIATVTLTVNVPEAALTIDGEEAGEVRGGRELQLPAGTHEIELSAEGYLSESRELNLAGGMVTDVDVELTRMAILRVDAQISGADLLIDGRSVGQTPFEGEMPLGNHTFRVEHDGYQPWEGEVEGLPGRTVRVRTELATTERRMSPAWFWTSLAFTVATGGVSIAMGALAMGRQDQYDSVVNDLQQGDLTPSERGDLLDRGLVLMDEIDSFALGFDISIGFTVSFAIAALVLGLLADFDEPESTADIQLSARPTFEPGGPGSLRLVF